MKFNKLRLLGFKSFVEPTEFVIEPGLTGVVGPNGCGKSNLVEALRWVMGENSYKNMRASSMDDVIFSGSGNRPSRNMAEVALFLDNDERDAPAAFNDADELQVSRRIEREAGSNYRINGKDVRAKDVQLLFADVSTGARSPSMIGQGRIGELISAKPQARRALLEEAAGISGLHSRRHEAELRLRAAENNLERVEDVLAQFETQLESLKRQARQANRYRNLAGEIRKAEATLLHLRWFAARDAAQIAAKALTEATMQVGETQLVQTEAAKAQAIIAHKLPELRENEAKAAAALQRHVISRNQLDDEEKRAARRKADLASRLEQLKADQTREEEMIAENSDILAHLDREEALLKQETGGREEKEKETRTRLEEATVSLTKVEEDLSARTTELASYQARRAQLSRTIEESRRRASKLEEQIVSTERDLDAVRAKISEQVDVASLSERVSALEASLEDAETDAAKSEKLLEEARLAEQAAREPVAEARAEKDRIETEAKTLARIVSSGGGDLFAPIVDNVKVDPGYEKAFGAALGDDLDAPTDPSAPLRWSYLEGLGDPELPNGVILLNTLVDAPKELTRRLAQVGVVERGEAENLLPHLKAGQKLVTPEGDLWRWDGFVASAEAPSAAAIRLEQKNRLAELDAEAVAAQKELAERQKFAEEAGQQLGAARDVEKQAREALRSRQNELGEARKALLNAERSVSEFTNRKSALEEGRTRLKSALEEASGETGKAEAELTTLPVADDLEQKAAHARVAAGEARARLAEVRAEFEGLARENAMRLERLSAIEREKKGWNDRAQKADRQIRTLKERIASAETELTEVMEAPDTIGDRRREILNAIELAEASRREAADRLAQCENDLREADKVAQGALTALSEAQQLNARAEERQVAAKEREQAAAARIREDLQCEPHMAQKIAELKEGDDLPEVERVEQKIERLRSERERLGAVNLRAEEEQADIIARRDELTSERDDLIEAIRKLRMGIQTLNKEGRERLLTAFDEVNAQFQKLFTHLFGGGTAELMLVESDDPLEAGLEIEARPPGKKPQTMTLLSGGEQALTAMALIFAVFLTNPAPICVLDEVDAPLDDHNVERFCNLMDQMAEGTDTRFVIITHNPITMARMSRLFGVTMAERGVSQLVSVDLETAESYREAG